MEELADKTKAPVLYGKEIEGRRSLFRIPHLLEIEKAEGDEIILRPRITEPPKTINDCLCYLDLDPRSLDGVIGYSGKELVDLQKLLICRDAYWKFADDWHPDWQDSNLKHGIKSIGEDVVKGSDATICCILAFPTEELRDAFWDNFKDLIVECKELL